jgi:hypothetical protein
MDDPWLLLWRLQVSSHAAKPSSVQQTPKARESLARLRKIFASARRHCVKTRRIAPEMAAPTLASIVLLDSA